MSDSEHQLHAACLHAIGQLAVGDPENDSPAGRALLSLGIAVENYERVHWPMDGDEISRCAWCGLLGVGFAQCERPADTCAHDPADIRTEEAGTVNSAHPELIDAADAYADDFGAHAVPADDVRAVLVNAFFAGSRWGRNDLVRELEQAGEPRQIKDHEIAAAVNQLRDIAIDYHATQQLRDRISRVVVRLVKGDDH